MAYQKTPADVLALFKKVGDIGSVAQELGKGQEGKGKSLLVADVYEKLLEIAKDSGQGSQDAEIEKMADLLKSLDPLFGAFCFQDPRGAAQARVFRKDCD